MTHRFRAAALPPHPDAACDVDVPGDLRGVAAHREAAKLAARRLGVPAKGVAVRYVGTTTDGERT